MVCTCMLCGVPQSMLTMKIRQTVLYIAFESWHFLVQCSINLCTKTKRFNIRPLQINSLFPEPKN